VSQQVDPRRSRVSGLQRARGLNVGQPKHERRGTGTGGRVAPLETDLSISSGLLGESRWRSWAEHALEFVALLDRQGRIKYLNHRLPDSHFDIQLGERLYDVLTSEHRSVLQAAVERVFETGVADQYETVGQRGSERFWLDNRVIPVKRAGTVAEVMLISADITRRRRAEELRRDIEGRFQAILHQEALGICDSDLTGRILSANQGCCDLLGRSMSQLLGRTFLSFVHPTDLPRVMDLMQGMVAGSQSWELELQYLRPDSSPILIRHSASLIRNPAGKRQAVLSTLQDITRRRQAEERAARQSRVLNSVPDAIIELDEQFRVITWTHAAETLFGWTSEEALGRSGDDLLRLGNALGSWARLHQMVGVSGPFRARLPQARKDGTLVSVELSVQTVGSLAGQPPELLVLCRGTPDPSRGAEATERYRLEREVRVMHEELRLLATRLDAAREEEQARISRELHDELGQSLTGLKMDLAWLVGQPPLTGSQLQDQARSILRTIDAITASVRDIASELRPDLLDELGLLDAVDSHVRRFERRTGIRCDLRLPPRLPRVGADVATALFRIIQEALTNVARHAGAAHVRIKLAARSGQLTLQISDNGAGIAETEVSGERSLGLLGMRERASGCGGNFMVWGVPKRGTRIIVRIPLRQREQEHPVL
jgi:PAS domain S-box-containing protein